MAEQHKFYVAGKTDPDGNPLEGLEDPLTDSTRKDLDETRRLLYMALVVSRTQTKRYNLAGTIVNALRHHQRVDVDLDELVHQVVGAVDGAGDDSWLLGQIDRISDELGD